MTTASQKVKRTKAERKTTRPRGFIENYSPHEKTRQLIALVLAVLDEYADQLPLTLRQIFYRLVARHGFAKTEKDYKRLGEHLGNARRGGLVAFDAIRDDTFYQGQFTGYESRADFLRIVVSGAENFPLDLDKSTNCAESWFGVKHVAWWNRWNGWRVRSRSRSIARVGLITLDQNTIFPRDIQTRECVNPACWRLRSIGRAHV